MRHLLAAVCLALASVSVVYAQADSDDFQVRVFGNTDLTPPTTPTLLRADPIAPTQIDLTWSTSTDNFVVQGYVVTRDSTPIATTTQLTFSDTSLTASTTYAYSVQAFDAASNYSTSSNIISTTTPNPPPPPAPTPDADTDTTEGTIARVVTERFEITTGRTTSTFNLTTAHPARVELRWGRTTSYELGYSVSNTFTSQHTINVNDLEPGTTYDYELLGYTPAGAETVVRRGVFTTEAVRADIPPANVRRFSAVREGSDVALSWELPTGDDIAHVRVVRSHLGFPEHPQDGAVVYQGLDSAAVDEAVLEQYSPVYYTAFVIDAERNVSSGAIALVYALPRVPSASPPGPVSPPPSTSEPPREIGESLPLEEATSTVDEGRVTPDMLMPSAERVFVEQGERTFTLGQSNIELDDEQPFLVYVPASVVSGNLKSIIVTMVDPTDNRVRHSFLLRINKDRSAYEALIEPLGLVGKSRIVVEIYDYEAFVVARYQAPVTFTEAAASPAVAEPVVFPDLFLSPANRPWLLLIVLSFALSLALLLVYRLRHGEDNEGDRSASS